MTKLINLIAERKFNEAEQELSSMFVSIMEQKLFEMKKATAAKMCEQMGPTTSQKRHMGVIEAADPKDDSMSIERGTPQQPKNTTVVPKNEPGSTHYKNMEEDVIKDMKAQEKSRVEYQLNKIKAMTQGSIASGVDSVNRIEKPIAPDPKFPNDKTDPGKYNSPTSDKQKRGLPEETEELDEARINIIKARIRGGKVQRRKKVSNVPGMTLRGGTLKRMSAAERRRRKMGARKAKMKRKAKMTRTLMKRKRSLQKRKSLGL